MSSQGAILKVRFLVEVQQDVPSAWVEANKAINGDPILEYYSKEIKRNLEAIQEGQVNYVMALGYDIHNKEVTE